MRFILVASNLGRCGTSSMMGMLKLCGVNLGKNLSSPNKYNKKGFFELLTVRKFTESTFGKFYDSNLTVFPTIKQLISITNKNYKQFNNILKNEFNSNLCAIKSQRYLNTMIFNKLNYKVDVICMHRNIDAQAKSTKNILQSGTIKEKNMTIDIIKNGIIGWKKVSNEIKEYCNKFKYYDVEFSNFINNPIIVMKKLTKNLNIKYPGDKIVNNWVEKRLVNF